MTERDNEANLKTRTETHYLVIPFTKPQNITYKAICDDYDVDIDIRVAFTPDILPRVIPILQRNYFMQQTPSVDVDEIELLRELTGDTVTEDTFVLSVMNGTPTPVVFAVPMATVFINGDITTRFKGFVQTRYLAGKYRPLLGIECHDYHVLSALGID